MVGSGAGAFMLIHGLLGSNRYWDGCYDRLAAPGRRVIVPDLMGFGPSLRVADGYGAASQAVHARSLLAEVGVTGPVVVGGHSFGSLVSLELAALAPELVRGLVLFSPPIYTSKESARRHIRHSGAMARLGLTSGRLAEAVCNWHCRHRRLARTITPLLSPRLPRAVAEDSAWHSWPAFEQALRSILDTDAERLVDGLQCPVEFVMGEADPVIDIGEIAKIARPLARTVTTVINADHHLPLKEVALCLGRLGEMWDRTTELGGHPKIT